MVFGLQKLTLLDFPGAVACTVFIPGCNFRCPFCHNASLVQCCKDKGEGMLEREELFSFLKKRSGLLDGVCITGGEPLLYEETFALLKEIKVLGYKVKLDTNGSFPERLKTILEEKCVDYIAMDIKNSPEKYAVTSGNMQCLENVKKSVELLKKGGLPYEFRTTVTGNLHTKEDFIAVGRWIEGAEKYFLQPFTDSGDVLVKEGGYAVSDELMAQYLETVKKFVPNAVIRGR